MPRNPNQGPCSVIGCENSGPYRNFNKTVYAKSINSGTFSNFDYLIVNESQLCSPHYLQVCEPAKGKKCIAFENKNINEQNKIFTIKNLLDNLNNQNTMLIDVSLNDIYVNITDDSITMTNDDFNSLINKIYQMQKQIEQQNEITLIEDEKVEPEIEEGNCIQNIKFINLKKIHY